MTDTTNLAHVEAEALQIMRDIVAAKGRDYVYPDSEKDSSGMCRYLTRDSVGNPVGPSCIVGHYLVAKGTPLDSLKDAEGLGAHSVVNQFVDDTTDRLLIAFEVAQDYQDAGKTWGDALNAFEERLGTKKDEDDDDL